jgi:hypothetical protein
MSDLNGLRSDSISPQTDRSRRNLATCPVALTYFKVETPLHAVADMLDCTGYVDHVISKTEARQDANRIGHPSAYSRRSTTAWAPKTASCAIPPACWDDSLASLGSSQRPIPGGWLAAQADE